MHCRMPPVRPRPRQRGFVLITVFLVILLLLTLGGAVLLSTQSDLQVSGYDREAAIALYAAEAGVAFGKDWLAGRVSGTGAGAWTVLLRSGDALLCAPGSGAAPGVQPKANNAAVSYDVARSASYRFCIHNNALDDRYFDSPATGDTEDSDGMITIESYGFGPGGAASRLTVEVSAGTTSRAVGDYFQGGGDGRKGAVGEATGQLRTLTTSF